MRFAEDFDSEKSATTKAERGIDFVEARQIWEDPFHVDVPAKFVGEDRTATVGMKDGLLWVAIWTQRDSGARIISVRRAEGTKFETAYLEDLP